MLKTFARTLLRWVGRSATGPGPHNGIPPGLPRRTLDRLCREHLGESLRACSYEQLSSWKLHGAHRLHLVTDAGTEWRLIFKDDLCSEEITPGLRGLPVLPGPPEATVYGLPCSTLDRFLPRVLWSREVEPGRHFQHLLEDLGATHDKLVRHPASLPLAARATFEIHAALEQALESAPAARLLRYDRGYREQLRPYVLEGLKVYGARRPDAAVAELCARWPEVMRAHEGEEPAAQSLEGPIHGDFNTSNVLVHRERQGEFKVVDWEWAGIGVPHADLAALLKLAGPEEQRAALESYAAADRRLDLTGHLRLLRWCQLERRLLDAGFLARQVMASRRRVPWLEAEIGRAAADVLTLARQLDGARPRLAAV